MPTNENADHALPYAIPEGADEESQRLIDSWRYRGPTVGWDAIVGHRPQIQRCRELIEKLRRSKEDLDRLRIRTGAGMVVSGPPGVGKTLLARALASELGREVIVVPAGELTNAGTVHRLYAQLAKQAEPVVVLLDDAEIVIGRSWHRNAEQDVLAAFLDSLDGIDRPAHGPITVALTTNDLDDLDEAAVRPGRLAPRLVLERPTAEERLTLLSRLVDGLPTNGPIDLPTVVDRTGGWTGAELAGAIEEACTRSLLDGSDALRQDLLLDVVAERYVVTDEATEEDWDALQRIATHESGHCLYGWLAFPGGVASVKLVGRRGETLLRDSVLREVADVQTLRRHAEMALAGTAAELVRYGPGWVTEGGHRDKAEATGYLLRMVAITKPYAVDPLEAGHMSDHGSERMRAGWHAEIETLAAEAQASALRWLAPHGAKLRGFAELLLEAPAMSLSGDELEAAIEKVWPGVTNLYGDEDASPRNA